MLMTVERQLRVEQPVKHKSKPSVIGNMKNYVKRFNLEAERLRARVTGVWPSQPHPQQFRNREGGVPHAGGTSGGLKSV